MKKQKILFICKHNIFRSRTAEELFNKFNKNKKYFAESAGIIKWEKKFLKGDKGFEAEKEVAKRFGANIKPKSRILSASLLKNTDFVIIVADDVHPSIFKDKSFKGKTIVWKIKDVQEKDMKKIKSAHASVEQIDKKIKSFIKKLK